MVLKAALGVYLHGLCGDLAAAEKGKRSMLAGDIIEYLPGHLAIGEEESKSYGKIQQSQSTGISGCHCS